MVTPGILGKTSACALVPRQCLPGPVFHPVTLIKQGLGTRLRKDLLGGGAEQSLW